GRTSDGNGSHASTLKSPSYTKSVSWQHYLGSYLNKRNVSLVIKQKIFAQSISFVIKIILPDTMKL
ncbi:hypothetical protein SNA86_01960, partial [Escherichia coli]|nr:hypothetical protein [Escherichia coli]